MGVEDAPPAAMAGGWSAIARKDAAPPVKPKVSSSAVRSKSGLSTIVVDTNAVIGSGAHLLGSAERFVTVREVLEEVRDPMSRMNLAALPIRLEILEPDSDAFTKGERNLVLNSFGVWDQVCTQKFTTTFIKNCLKFTILLRGIICSVAVCSRYLKWI